MLTQVMRRGRWLGVFALLLSAQGCGDDEPSSKSGTAGSGTGGSLGSSGAGQAQPTAGAMTSSGTGSGGSSSNAGSSSGSSQGGTATPPTAGSTGQGGGSAGSNNGTAGSGGSGSGNVSKSAGCGKAAPLAAAEQKMVTIGADQRGYLLVPPTNYNNNTAYPIVFVFHGGGGTGSQMRAAITLEAAAQGQAVFVYPDGLGNIWDLKNDGPDAKLFDSIVTTVQDGFCTDKNSIFTAGFSYGGWAATQTAKARPTVVRGIVSIAGGGPQGGSNNDPPVAAMMIHGMNDTAEPPGAGEDSTKHFVATNKCAATTQDVDPSPCKAYTGCMPGKPVQWCLHPGFHEVPGFAPPAIWKFFNSLR